MFGRVSMSELFSGGSTANLRPAGKSASAIMPLLVFVCLACVLDLSAAGEPASPHERSVDKRMAGRSFPSIFQAWSGAGSRPLSPDNAFMPRHDLVFQGPTFYGLRWNERYPGQATGFDPKSTGKALATRRRLLRENPSMVLLAELRHRDAPRRHLPAEHPWWRRVDGKPVEGWKEGRFYQLDISNPEFRRHLALQAAALMKTGVVDGIMLDWWNDTEDQRRLVREIRSAIGDEPLILVNSNDRQIPLTAPWVNGLFMECTKTKTPADWQRIASTLAWAEKSLRSPRINCLETWWHQSRKDIRLMRLTTTLSLVISDGYCLFSDPNPLPIPDHGHDWYRFWDVDLGRPLEPAKRPAAGLITRCFERGVVACNIPGNRMATLSFDKEHRSWMTGVVSRNFRINPGDGDFFLQQ